MCVEIWVIAEGNVPTKYERESVWLRKVYNDDFSLVQRIVQGPRSG